MKLLAVIVAVLALAFGQGRMEASVPGRFEVVLLGGRGVSDMTVVLWDTTGAVRALVPGRPGDDVAITEAIDDGRAHEFEWLGGQCDDYTYLRLNAIADGYELTAFVGRTALNGGRMCQLFLGVPRAVTLVLTVPIPSDSIRFSIRR